MPTETVILLAGVVFGLGVGLFTARTSARRDPIYGGAVARFFHYLAASVMTALPLTVIASAAVGGFLRALTVGLGFFVTLWGCALIFAWLERPAREVALARKVDLGWTEQDARTSGL
ncbi:MAG: hypothetical protein ACOYL5_00060 [Phototrophicaceae bacterium]|jgi:hypothetical protein